MDPSTPESTKPKLEALRIERTPVRARRRRRWPYVVGALLIVALAGGFWLRTAQPLEVETTSVTLAYPSQSAIVLSATGYAVPQRKAAVASKATGRLEWLGVEEGSRVKAGDVIARLESEDVSAGRDRAAAALRVAEAGLRQAEAERFEATREFRRTQQLVAQNFMSKANLDQADARLRRSDAAIASARAQISANQAALREAEVARNSTLIRAPFDGVILSKQANVGDVITPFAAAADSKGAVVTMADLGTLEIEADVSESSLGKVRVGQPCEIELDAIPDRRFLGEVSRIVPTVDRAKATVLAKIRFIEKDPRILPDMSAKVSFLSRGLQASERQPLLAVDAAALTERDGRTLVFRVDRDQVNAVAVTAGRNLGNLRAITGKLSAGDKVVLNPDPKLTDGSKIRTAATK